MSLFSHYAKKAAGKFRARGIGGLLQATVFRLPYLVPLLKTATRRALHGPAKKKTLWIHIGAHKTGSTSLQGILEGETESLMAYSIAFEPFGFHLAERLANHSPLPPDELEKVRAEFRNRVESHPEEVIILSGEYFFGHPDVCYRNTEAVAEDLRRITDGYDIRLVACVRRQDDFVQSWYHQRIKMGGCETFEEFKKAVGLQTIEWDKLMGHFEQRFGADRLRVLIFEKLKSSGGDLLHTCFSGLGHPFEIKVRPFRRYNPSYSEKALHLALLCYPQLDQTERKKLRFALFDAFPRQRGEKFTQFTEDERRSFMTAHRDSNRRFFEKYAGSADEAKQLGYED
jgi:hypothetical protein